MSSSSCKHANISSSSFSSMSDANYVWVGTAEKYTSWYPSVVQYDNSERTTTYIPVGISDAYGGAGWTDSAGVSIIIFSN